MTMTGLKSQFLELGAAAKYDLITAARGPDIHDSPEQVGYYLKRHITSRIRGMIFDTGVDTGVVSTRLLCREDFDHLCKFKELKPLQWSELYHFRVHLREAIRVTVDHPVWGGFGRDLVDILMG